MGRLVFCVILSMLVAGPALAVDQYQFRGKMSGPEGTIRGQVTVSTNAIEVQKRFLWVQDSVSYDFKNTKSVRVRRGLLRTRVRVREAEGGQFVEVKTWSWHYTPLRELLKEKL